MTLMLTLESVGPARKVVDLEDLHRYRYFPDWTTIDFCLLKKLQGSTSVKTMEYRQFLAEMTLMLTPESVGPAGKVVDLEELHRYRYSPDYTTMNWWLLEVQQAQKPLFSTAE